LLSIKVSGDGTIHSTSTSSGIPSDIVCSSGICSARYPVGSLVDLTAIPSWYSKTVWDYATDSRGGNMATVTMNDSRMVAANFVADQNVQISNPNGYLGSIKRALETAVDGASIKARNINFPDLLTFNRTNTIVTLSGGWMQLSDAGPSGYSTIQGPVYISGGRINISGVIKVQP
jgi:hypothetical protein